MIANFLANRYPVAGAAEEDQNFEDQVTCRLKAMNGSGCFGRFEHAGVSGYFEKSCGLAMGTDAPFAVAMS